MPPPGYEPFLREICENPEDDTVRLIYADWLDENGDPDRAEFIRLQIAMGDTGSELDERGSRVRSLRKKRAAGWLAELPNIKGVLWGQFRRGFVGTAAFDNAGSFCDGAELAFAATPLDAVNVHGITPGLFHWFLATNRFSRLREFHASGYVDDLGVTTLAHTPAAMRLRRLTLPGVDRVPSADARVIWLTDAAAFALANSRYLVRLESLTLDGSSLSLWASDALLARFGRGLRLLP
jgi:uncharacterized protein (TIGR02996 family)